MGSFPYHSHIFRDSYGSGMGIVWEAYHKGVPLLRVPGISLEVVIAGFLNHQQYSFTKGNPLLDAFHSDQ